MRRLWAVARQTFIESIRARVTVVFMFALGGAILLAPVIASGPGLREQVQTTLVYSVGLASIIISVLTILLGCSLLCGEIQSRQIFTPITKPVPRWQYIVGRWLGLALLEVMLVAGAGAATYVSVKVLCYQASDAGARLAVENEVLCSRVRHEPTSAGKTVREMIAERIEELQKEGKLEEAIAKDGPEAVQKALQTWASNRLQQFQTAPFLGGLQWFFTGLQRPAGANAMIQFRFKAKTTRDPPDKALHCQWIFTNPDTGVFFARPNPTNRAETFPIDIETTFTLPGQVISDDGRLNVVFYNVHPRNPRETFPTAVTIAADDVYVLYRVGLFGPNFVRAMMLVLCVQLFLAAMAVFAGSWLSLPVACLWCFVAFVLSAMSPFLTETMKFSAGPGVWGALSRYTWAAAKAVLPDIAAASPTDSLVDGLLIPWFQVAKTAGVFVFVWSTLPLVLAAVIFTRRELAGVIAE